jgi:poly(A) polymerase
MLDNYEFLRGKREEFANEPLIPQPLVTGHDLINLGLKPGRSSKRSSRRCRAANWKAR